MEAGYRERLETFQLKRVDSSMTFQLKRFRGKTLETQGQADPPLCRDVWSESDSEL